MRKTDAFRRAAALLAALSITVSLAAPAFAGTYYIDDGDITITKDENGQTVQQGNNAAENIGADEEIIITTHKKAITTLESDLEGPAAEDSGFGPVVEDNYQPAAPAQPEDADQPENADQQKDADQRESADQQAQPQQAAPAASTPVNKKENGFWGNTITVFNKLCRYGAEPHPEEREDRCERPRSQSRSERSGRRQCDHRAGRQERAEKRPENGWS